MEIVIQVVAAILVFGLLIFVHELGHFTVGKLSEIGRASCRERV